MARSDVFIRLRARMEKLYDSNPDVSYFHAMRVRAGEKARAVREWSTAGYDMLLIAPHILGRDRIWTAGHHGRGEVAPSVGDAAVFSDAEKSPRDRLLFSLLDEIAEVIRPELLKARACFPGTVRWGGLLEFLYAIAWKYPDEVSYRVRYETMLDSTLPDWYPVLADADAEFTSFERFSQWKVRQWEPSAGTHLMCLKGDLRACVMSALDAMARSDVNNAIARRGPQPSILAIAPPETPERARDRYFYEQGMLGVPWGVIHARAKATPEWPEVVLRSVSDRAEAHRIRNDLPLLPQRKITRRKDDASTS